MGTRIQNSHAIGWGKFDSYNTELQEREPMTIHAKHNWHCLNRNGHTPIHLCPFGENVGVCWCLYMGRH